MARAEAALVTNDARLLNRELSWLDYNARVLARAADTALPLLERSRNCAYFSSNLDEFFQVRVAGLISQEEAGLQVRTPDGRTAADTHAEVRKQTLDLTARQAKLWKRELRPALAEAGVIVGDVEDCTPKELDLLEGRFDQEIFPILTPLAVGPGQPFPYISPLSLSLGTFVRDPQNGEERFARVKVPELLPRFLPVGDRGLFIPLERIIRHFLPRLFSDMEILECCAFRVTRDADFEVSDEADDLLEAVEDELRRRRFGDVVRVEVSGSVSTRMLERLERGLGVTSNQIYLIPGLLDLADLHELVDLDRPDLKEERWYPVAHPRFASAADADDLFAEIRRSDILVHHPFDSFASSFESFLLAAARDPAVLAVKTALYRTSEDSPVVPALIEAAERGKQSVSLIELKARFDEYRNIGWSRSLEQAGVHVVYGFPNLKIHAKTTLIVRREGGQLRRYVHLGTGNYNILTARSYEDYGLFTADTEIAADVADLFNHLTGFGRPHTFRKLLVAPVRIARGPGRANSGGTARCRERRRGTHQDQGEQPQRRRAERRALPCLAGGRKDRHRRAQHLHASPGSAGHERGHPRPQHSRTLPGAQPGVYLRRRREENDLDGKRGPDVAKPRSPHRARRTGPGRACATRSGSCVRSPARRQRVGVGAEPRWTLDEAPAEEGRSQPARPAGLHAQRSRPRPPPSRVAPHTLIASLRRLLRPGRAPTDTPVRIVGVRVGIVDVGANTVRLLVATAAEDSLVSIREDRVQLGLGEEIERTGRIGEKKLAEAAEAARASRPPRAEAQLQFDRCPRHLAGPASGERHRPRVPARCGYRCTDTRPHRARGGRACLARRRGRDRNAPREDRGLRCRRRLRSDRNRYRRRPSWVRSLDIGSLRLTRRAFREDPPDAEDFARATTLSLQSSPS